MTRSETFNFSAGPSVLPEEVLRQAQAELLNYHGTGMSVMEMSHRSQAFSDIFQDVKARFRAALSVPDTHEILFLQGGGTAQFSMIPLNLMGEQGTADYAVTGHFSGNAAKEAEKYGAVHIAADTSTCGHTRIPQQSELQLDARASYFYYCANNTIYGTEWQYVPETSRVPLACDMSSDILSRPVDVSKYGVIFAGAQKNMAPAGLTVAIVDRSLAGHELPITPVMYSYQPRRAGAFTSSVSCSRGWSGRAAWRACSSSSMRAPQRCTIFSTTARCFIPVRSRAPARI